VRQNVVAFGALNVVARGNRTVPPPYLRVAHGTVRPVTAPSGWGRTGRPYHVVRAICARVPSTFGQPYRSAVPKGTVSTQSQFREKLRWCVHNSGMLNFRWFFILKRYVSLIIARLGFHLTGLCQNPSTSFLFDQFFIP
jgi:hypothetical protein